MYIISKYFTDIFWATNSYFEKYCFVIFLKFKNKTFKKYSIKMFYKYFYKIFSKYELLGQRI